MKWTLLMLALAFGLLIVGVVLLVKAPLILQTLELTDDSDGELGTAIYYAIGSDKADIRIPIDLAFIGYCFFRIYKIRKHGIGGTLVAY